jgi:hypothetical protein
MVKRVVNKREPQELLESFDESFSQSAERIIENLRLRDMRILRLRAAR